MKNISDIVINNYIVVQLQPFSFCFWKSEHTYDLDRNNIRHIIYIYTVHLTNLASTKVGGNYTFFYLHVSPCFLSLENLLNSMYNITISGE